MKWIAPPTAAVMIAQQVGANATRDALFLTHFPVTAYPFLIVPAAILSFPAAQWTGRLLARFGPARTVPLAFGVHGLLFLIEYGILHLDPRVATVMLYVHSAVVGSLVVSIYWSLLNERFDPHSAKHLLSHVASGAALGGLLGGIGAGLAGTRTSPALVLPLLAAFCVLCACGSLLLKRGWKVRAQSSSTSVSAVQSAWAEIRRVPYLADLAIVSAQAACLATLADFFLKAEVAQHVGRHQDLMRFFGFFYAGTAISAFLIQTTLGKKAIKHLGLAGLVASHPIAMGLASVIGFFVPAPWRGILPRGVDLTIRNSVYRAGYELLYTPLANESKRSAKAMIDVGFDSLGKAIGALIIFVLAWISPGQTFLWICLAAVVAAAAGELAAVRPLRNGYVKALEDGLRYRGNRLEEVAEISVTDFISAKSLLGLDRNSILGALETASAISRENQQRDDPMVRSILELRSENSYTVRRALKENAGNPNLVGFVIPLLARREMIREVVAYLQGFGSSIAGQLTDALLNPQTPETVRKRLPLILKSALSDRSVNGLISALSDPSFDVRRRCGRALLTLSTNHPELVIPAATIITRVVAELDSDRSLKTTAKQRDLMDHVFALLEIALEREPLQIAKMALTSQDLYLRGTAVEYLETVLPPGIFARLIPFLDLPQGAAGSRREIKEVKADLLRAHESSALRIARQTEYSDSD